MKAKAVNYPSGPVVAFGGIEFVVYEWRVVPSGCEAEAERHPFLEVLEEDTQFEAQPAPALEAVEVAPKPKPRRRRTVKVKE